MTTPDRRSVKPTLIRGFILAALSLGLAHGPIAGQSAGTASPTFEADEVKVRPKSTYPYSFGNSLRGNQYEFRNATMMELIATAYGVAAEEIVGGPSWLEIQRFDIAARAPATASREDLNRMLRALLTDRFQLEVRNEAQPQPALALDLLDGKHKLKEADPDGEPGCQTQLKRPAPGETSSLVATCRNMTMDALARQLRSMGGDYITVPVVDRTDLKGSWDFDLRWTMRPSLQIASSSGISLNAAFEKQLGLTLQSTTMPVPVLSVDRVSRSPSLSNHPLPPSAPPEFEVAVVKPSGPETRGKNQILLRQNGQADIQGVTLKRLIKVAWQDTTNDWSIGGPDFLDSARYDIAAKFPDGYSNIDQEAGDLLELMLRALLADRFKVAVHREDREVSVYTLLTTKPKLKPADPASRTTCKTGPAPLTENPASGAMRMTTCTNMTMADFADGLQRIANGYIDTPVFDATGLTGSFDFNLIYSRAGALQIAPAANGAVAEAADPNGAISLMDALSQLGLKLEKQKHKMPVLVIDHAEEKPTEN